MFEPVPIDTSIRLASMRQIHCAIDHLERGNYECAITLAAAAEGMMPEPEKPYFRGKVKAMAQSEEIKAAGGAIGPNDYSVWLKHGTFNGVKTEEVMIPNEEGVVWIYRAISKFHAVYDDRSPQMISFCKWAKDWLTQDLARTTSRVALLPLL
ncbi:MAG: hypothetical protein WBF58_15070 [Xanthobacteraceae bacterium]